MKEVKKENVIKALLLANIVFSLIVTLYAIGAALGTGLLMGSITLNLSVVAYFIHRNGRVILGLVGKDITEGQAHG